MLSLDANVSAGLWAENAKPQRWVSETIFFLHNHKNNMRTFCFKKICYQLPFETQELCRVQLVSTLCIKYRLQFMQCERVEDKLGIYLFIFWFTHRMSPLTSGYHRQSVFQVNRLTDPRTDWPFRRGRPFRSMSPLFIFIFGGSWTRRAFMCDALSKYKNRMVLQMFFVG